MDPDPASCGTVRLTIAGGVPIGAGSAVEVSSALVLRSAAAAAGLGELRVLRKLLD